MGICVSYEEKQSPNLPTSQINNQKFKKNSNHASYYYQNSQLKDSIFQTSPNCSETQSIGSTNASVLMEKKNSQQNNPLQFSNLLQSNLKNKKQIAKQDYKEDTESQDTEFFSIDDCDQKIPKQEKKLKIFYIFHNKI
ncbi:hypothetical protein PPERSA_11240 [Pseudocohnilembus persalinus]|uniref:Uncharacterized protein n=1 Tax=Pseudocohnilembus persalinus TaxID=266149 RepID=A0A0V0QZR0_PSEPJ|nr:hypothetical protein PPERSA_11240 [Pseudocohnilembus persalinus]|eukprot:KRX07691.1 hypothetical protein PPERSA_11240 [Pseudocohnilembus persalinus]